MAKNTLNIKKMIKEEIEKIDESASFSRRHYQTIADILRTSKTKDDIATQLANMFEEDNPLFLRDKFFKAAGIQAK